MKASVVLSTLVFAAVALAQNLTVSTPAQLVGCQPGLLQWGGGTPPYYPSIIPGGQTGAAALVNFPETSDTSYTWNPVNIQAGTSITIEVRDSSGQVQYSSPVIIQAGSSTSCVGQTISGGSATGSATAPPASGSASASASMTSASGASTASSASTAASPSATKSSALGLKAGVLSVVGIAGLVGAALF